MQEIDRENIARNWASRGFTCDLWVDPPGQRWEDFVHDVDELVIVVEGVVEFEVDSELHHPNVGDELFIPAGARHSARNTGSSTARWLYGYHRP